MQELVKPLIIGHQTSVAAYFRELYRIGVYPSDLSTSVDSTIANLKELDSSILKTVNCGCHHCFKIGDLSEAVREIGAQARSWAESICLDCIRHGGRIVNDICAGSIEVVQHARTPNTKQTGY